MKKLGQECMGHRGVRTGGGKSITSLLGNSNLGHIVENEFLGGLNDYFGEFCDDENYVKPVPLEVNPVIHPPPELQKKHDYQKLNWQHVLS